MRERQIASSENWKEQWYNGTAYSNPFRYAAPYNVGGYYEGVSSTTKQMFDVEVPNFRARVNAGEVFFNACTIVSSQEIPDEGYIGLNYATYGLQSYSTGAVCMGRCKAYVIGYLPTPVVSENANAERIVKLRAIASMDQPDFLFAESIAESRKTAQYLKQRLSGVHSITNKMIRNARAEPKKFEQFVAMEKRTHTRLDKLDKIPSFWLEARFAVTPLLNDISNALLAYGAHGAGQRPLRRSSRARHEDVGDSSDTVTASIYMIRRHSVKRIIHRASILYEVLPPHHENRSYLGLRAQEWAVIPWALTPYSFLVDRVIDISSAITAAANMLNPELTILGASYSKDTLSEAERQLVGCDTTSNPVYAGSTATSSVNKKITREYTRVGWDLSLSDVIPPVTPKGLVDDWKKVADLASLVNTRVTLFKRLYQRINQK